MECWGDPFIGIRGACENGSSGLDWSMLTGIDLDTASKAANGLNGATGIQYLKGIEKSAIKLVTEHFINSIPEIEGLQFNSIVGEVNHNSSGRSYWTGCEDNFYHITWSKFIDDKFMKVCIPYIGLNVIIEKGAKYLNKTIYVQTEEGEKKIKHKFKNGYNRIPLDIETNSCWIDIFFNPIGLRIGKKRECNGCSPRQCNICNPCVKNAGYLTNHFSHDGICKEHRHGFFGYDICVQCRCDHEALACHFKKDLAMSVLYQGGILMMLDKMNNTDVSACIRNTKQDAEKLYILWKGAHDNVTGYRHKGEYGAILKGAIKRIGTQLCNINSPCFSRIGRGTVNPAF